MTSPNPLNIGHQRFAARVANNQLTLADALRLAFLNGFMFALEHEMATFDAADTESEHLWMLALIREELRDMIVSPVVPPEAAGRPG